MPRERGLSCGCSAAGPCPRGAELFARSVRGRTYLYWHLEAGLRDRSATGLHSWEHQREGDVLSRCRHCGAEQAEGKRWRERGGEWKSAPMPECTGRAAEQAKIARVRAAARRRRAA